MDKVCVARYAIVTDSSCNLPESLIEAWNLNILSLSYWADGVEYPSYVPGQVLDLPAFYARLRNRQLITTTLANPALCERIFRALLEKGQDILYIGFSSALSGTYQAALLALEGLKDDFPNRKMLAVDSLSASLGQGLLLRYAVRMRDEGRSLEENHQWLLDNRLHLCHWFTVDDLFFLKRGGRVSATVAVLGTMLSIKPVMHMDNEGRLTPVSNVRGRRKALDALVEHMAATAIHPETQTIHISHGDCLDDAEYVAKRVRERLHVPEVFIHFVEPVIGAHSGPGTVALFFLGTER